MVVKGRNDLVVAQTGTNLLRDLLIRTMAMENAAQFFPGLARWRKSSTRRRDLRAGYA